MKQLCNFQSFLKRKRNVVHGILLVLLVYLPQTRCAIEEIEATPTNTNGIELGELSLAQLLMIMLVFLKLVLLYSVGVLPLEIDLGGMLDPLLREKRNIQTMATSTYLLDCPLQFVCEVDAWANRDHSDSFLEGLLASWFKNPKHTWTHPHAKLYSGIGTCREMYPCPFDVQQAMGVNIPGSNTISSDQESDDSIDGGTIYMSFVDADSDQDLKLSNNMSDNESDPMFSKMSPDEENNDIDNHNPGDVVSEQDPSISADEKASPTQGTDNKELLLKDSSRSQGFREDSSIIEQF